MSDDELLDLRVLGGTVVTPDGCRRHGIGVKDGRIVQLAEDDLLPPAKRTIDATGRYVIPGAVDPEAHPGHTFPWELDAETETRAAAAAGVTTWGVQSPSPRFGQEHFKDVCDPEDAVSFHEVFERGRDLFERNSTVDFFFTFQIETDQHALEIPEYAERYGVTSFKFYGHYKDLDLDTWGGGAQNGLVRGWDDGTFLLALENAASIGRPGIVGLHPENWEIARVLEPRLRAAGRADIGAWDERSPDFAEAIHIRHYGYLAAITGCPLYVQHCTNARSVQEVVRAREAGAEVYVQTGPPWLFFTRDDWKIMPPLRDRASVEAVWEALRNGVVDAVGSDHIVGRGKREDWAGNSVWAPKGSGFASRVEMLLPVMLHEGVNRGRITIERLVEVMCSTPAKIFGLYPRKGAIEIGADADLVLVDLEREIEVADEHVWSRPGWSLLTGRRLCGWPTMTILGGRVIAERHGDDGRMTVVDEPSGRYLPRETAQTTLTTT